MGCDLSHLDCWSRANSYNYTWLEWKLQFSWWRRSLETHCSNQLNQHKAFSCKCAIFPMCIGQIWFCLEDSGSLMLPVWRLISRLDWPYEKWMDSWCCHSNCKVYWKHSKSALFLASCNTFSLLHWLQMLPVCFSFVLIISFSGGLKTRESLLCEWTGIFVNTWDVLVGCH